MNDFSKKYGSYALFGITNLLDNHKKQEYLVVFPFFMVDPAENTQYPSILSWLSDEFP